MLSLLCGFAILGAVVAAWSIAGVAIGLYFGPKTKSGVLLCGPVVWALFVSFTFEMEEIGRLQITKGGDVQ